MQPDLILPVGLERGVPGSQRPVDHRAAQRRGQRIPEIAGIGIGTPLQRVLQESRVTRAADDGYVARDLAAVHRVRDPHIVRISRRHDRRPGRHDERNGRLQCQTGCSRERLEKLGWRPGWESGEGRNGRLGQRRRDRRLDRRHRIRIPLIITTAQAACQPGQQ